MGMGFVGRIFRALLWPRRVRDDEEDEERPRRRKGRASRTKSPHPGVYRIEVDSEMGRFHGDGPPFSFWSSSRIILILSFILWWVQPAGPMIAGYVGGRRAGSPIKAVVAALLPVFAIFVANAFYSQSVASREIDFVASLPMVVSDALASILPFLGPYREFMVQYMHGFVAALSTTFGMGTNGYLMVIIFAYIGGLIADQTRRELHYRSGRGSSLGVNLVQPIFGARAQADDEDEEAYEDEEEMPRRRRHPTRARAHGRAVPVGLERRRHGRRERSFDRYRRVPAEVLEMDGRRRSTRSHHDAGDEDEDEDDGGEVVVARTKRISRADSDARRERHRPARTRGSDEDEEDEEREEASERRPARESRPLRTRTHEEERAIQRFVERALRNYDHSKL
jgi:hypothetical protein